MERYCSVVEFQQKVWTRKLQKDYKNKMIYDCFNNYFPANSGIPYLNPPPITMDDIPHLDQISHYTPDMLPDAVPVASEKSVSTLITPSYSPKIILLTSDEPNPRHSMKKDDPYCSREKMILL